MSQKSPTFERDDIQLVKLFLGGYKDPAGIRYLLVERPDTVERTGKAIEAVAVDKHSHRLAVEHTVVQAFEGKRDDDVPFLTAFERLRLDKSLLMSNRFIDVACPTFAIPKGKRTVWKEVGEKVDAWFISARNELPTDGQRWHAIPHLGFNLNVLVQTRDLPGTEGVIVVSRILPSDRPFIDALRTALHNKVPKLVGTLADNHILLLEDEGVAIGFSQITKGVESSVEGLPELNKVDELWLVKTMGWKTSGHLFYSQVWPGGVTQRFKVADVRYSSRKAASNE